MVDDRTFPMSNPLQFATADPLRFANETYGCPRIHFDTGMVEVPRKEELESEDSAPKASEESVIISYGGDRGGLVRG